MEDFTAQIGQIARRHNLSESSALQLANGLLRSGGGQVQFNIPEFGGMGQWMPGMVMAGDLFDNALKARVDNACADISQRVRSGQLREPRNEAPAGTAGVSLAWNRGGNWWPGDLGIPAATGGQNDLRYAWFPSTRRLAIDLGGHITLYDTADHNIGGVGQQQSGGGWTITFTSQFGVVDISALRRVT